MYSRWHLSWKGHILSISRKISKSIGIIYKSSLCLLYVLFDYSRPFLTPLVNILCFSKSHNSFSSSGIARGRFQGFQSPLPPPFGLWNWLYFKQRRRKIQKDIMCYIRGYSIIVITKISKRSTHEVFFLIFPSILIALVEAMRVKWAACHKLCVTQPVLYSFNSSLRWKYISSHVHSLQFCTHSRHNDAISFSHGCLQINLRELSGTWMLTSAVAWKTAHYTVQHRYHHSQKSSHSKAIYATRCWSAAAAPRHTETLKDWYKTALTISWIIWDIHLLWPW